MPPDEFDLHPSGCNCPVHGVPTRGGGVGLPDPEDLAIDHLRTELQETYVQLRLSRRLNQLAVELADTTHDVVELRENQMCALAFDLGVELGPLMPTPETRRFEAVIRGPDEIR